LFASPAASEALAVEFPQIAAASEVTSLVVAAVGAVRFTHHPLLRNSTALATVVAPSLLHGPGE